MNSHPRLSIITSVLNAEDTLNNTIESLFPLPKGVEWVFIDGGSTDGTMQIVKPHLGLPIARRVFPGTNLYQGFNHGLECALGDYVLYLNSGDTLLRRGNLITLMEEFRSEADVYYFRTQLNDNAIFPNKPLDKAYLQMPFSHQGCVMKTETLRRLGGFNDQAGPAADHELIVRMLLNDCKFEYLYWLCLVKCAPWKSTEDNIGRLLNRWRNIRNLMKKHSPEKFNEIDASYYALLKKEMQLKEMHFVKT